MAIIAIAAPMGLLAVCHLCRAMKDIKFPAKQFQASQSRQNIVVTVRFQFFIRLRNFDLSTDTQFLTRADAKCLVGSFSICSCIACWKFYKAGAICVTARKAFHFSFLSSLTLLLSCNRISHSLKSKEIRVCYCALLSRQLLQILADCRGKVISQYRFYAPGERALLIIQAIERVEFFFMRAARRNDGGARHCANKVRAHENFVKQLLKTC